MSFIWKAAQKMSTIHSTGIFPLSHPEAYLSEINRKLNRNIVYDVIPCFISGKRPFYFPFPNIFVRLLLLISPGVFIISGVTFQYHSNCLPSLRSCYPRRIALAMFCQFTENYNWMERHFFRQFFNVCVYLCCILCLCVFFFVVKKFIINKVEMPKVMLMPIWFFCYDWWWCSRGLIHFAYFMGRMRFRYDTMFGYQAGGYDSMATIFLDKNYSSEHSKLLHFYLWSLCIVNFLLSYFSIL